MFDRNTLNQDGQTFDERAASLGKELSKGRIF